MSQKPSCVFIANRLPWPLVDGWTRRTFHVVQALAEDSPVRLIVFHAGSDADRVAAEQAFGANVRVDTVAPRRFRKIGALLRSAVGSRPLHATGHDDARFGEAVDRAMADGSVTLWGCAGAYLTRYMPRRDPSGALLRFIDTHNIDSIAVERYARFVTNPLRKWFTMRTSAQLVKLEQQSFADADAVLVCSEQEIGDALERAPTACVRSIPNGVDLETFTVGERTTSSNPPTLLFFGRLDYFPNVDAMRHFTDSILTPLRALVPDVRVRIAGAGDDTALRAATKGDPVFTILGQVPDINEELRQADAVIVPLRIGGGTRLKVLEAMAAARPMVSTSIGAEGIEVEDGVHILLRDDANAFAEATAQLLHDSPLSARLGASARTLVESRYSWEAIGSLLRDDLARLAANSGNVTSLAQVLR